MELYKISKLLHNSTISKFVTKKWVKLNDLSSGQYSVNKNIRFKTSMLKSDSYHYSDLYTIVKGKIDVLAAANENDKAQKILHLTIMLHWDHALQKLIVH